MALGLAGGITALLVDRVAARTSNAKLTQTPAPATLNSKARNLSLQPEAFKLARRLGPRFSSGKNTTSVVAATLRLGSEARTVQMTRTQTEAGENVQITIERSSDTLTWDAKQGALSLDRPATGSQRELIERLVFDSPDQFVLMQFRGASYQTIARAVRPVNAPDGYDGPLWTIVRVNDPERDDAKRATSPWRLYYLNTTTGLIDRIECEVEGRRIVTEISSWIEQDGERIPAQIVWTRDGQTFMQYSLTNFSQNQGSSK